MDCYVTQEELKNLTKVDISDFALKTNVAEIKSKVDDTDVDKINGIDGLNYVESSYLHFNQRYEYFKVDEGNPHQFLLRKPPGVSNETFEPPEDKNTQVLLFEKIWPYLKIESFEFLAQKKLVIPMKTYQAFILFI